MKLCPQCSAKNSNEAKFCNSCGTGLENVPVSTDSASDFLNKATGILNDGAKLVKEAAILGAEKAKGAIEAGKEKMQTDSTTPPHAAPAGYTSSTQPKPLQGNANWEDAAQSATPKNATWDSAANPNDAASVTVEQYPFFRDEDEVTIAVIGEEAAAADLEGNYQKPYAILTQKRLYCKNEAGNFVMDASQIQTVGHNLKKVKTFDYALIFIFDLLMFGLFFAMPIETFFLRLFLTLAVSVCCAYILGVIARKKGQKPQKTFSIYCEGGTFSFLMDNYPSQDFIDFQTKAAPFCNGMKIPAFSPASVKQGTVSQNTSAGPQPPQKGRRNLVTVCVVVVIVAAIGIFFIYRFSHCKYPNCDKEVYENGYCKYHYAVQSADQALQGAFNKADDYLSGLFG